MGGAAVDAADGATIDLVDPSTGEVFATSPRSAPQTSMPPAGRRPPPSRTWRDTTPSDRQRALLKLADLVEEHADELVALESENTGKPIGLTAEEEVPPMVDQIRFFAGASPRPRGDLGRRVHGRPHLVRIRREPIGVCAQVTPWNYPMMMAVWKRRYVC
ncbi:MAG: aldehyde dehydrogenase family protein [Chitinophagaceae bacterium]